jgi:hypothetical protein
VDHLNVVALLRLAVRGGKAEVPFASDQRVALRDFVAGVAASRERRGCEVEPDGCDVGGLRASGATGG